MAADSEPAPNPKTNKCATPPKKRRKSRLERLAAAISLEFVLTWIQLSNIPPLQKVRIKKAFLDMYRYIFPAKRSSERRKDIEGEKEPKGERGGEKPKVKPSGRRGAEDFPNAPRVPHALEGVAPGDRCSCGGVFCGKPDLESLRFVAVPPIQPVVDRCEWVRCSSCNTVIRAKRPEKKRHDPTAISMVALMKYGSGFPFFRMAAFLGHFGLSLRASTQFAMVAAGIPAAEPVYLELQRQAALGEILQADDTKVRILRHARLAEFMKRTGLFTTGFYSCLGRYRISIFKSGAEHAGENMATFLKSRPTDLPTPIFMADALARNFPKLVEKATRVANCLSHGRRYFVDLIEAFPEHCRYVLDALGTVFFHDALAREQDLSPEDRLLFHQVFSQPIMDDLKSRMQLELDDKLTEANSRLGKAFSYMLKHWERLTLFLRVAGAPLENNAVERQLKKAVLHRKNSLFYRSDWGAKVGDIYMSLIYTCELNGVNAFDYLTKLQTYSDKVAADPAHWMPWNYLDTLKHIQGFRDEHDPRGSPDSLAA
jgi:transposase